MTTAGMSKTKVTALARELRKLNDKSGPTNKERARMEKIQNQLAAEFGRRRGWKQCEPGDFESAYRDFVGSEFGAQDLGHWYFDHSYLYRMPDGRYAIASHIYDCGKERIAEHRAFAEKHDLTVEYPTDFPSWWYPGHTKLVLWYPTEHREEEKSPTQLMTRVPEDKPTR